MSIVEKEIIFAEYANFTNIFLKKLAIILLKKITIK